MEKHKHLCLFCSFCLLLFGILLIPTKVQSQCATGTFTSYDVISAEAGSGTSADPASCPVTIEFCYDIETFSEETLNYLHGIFLLNTPTDATVSLSNGATGLQATADGDGNKWIFINQAQVAASPGLAFPGYYVDSVDPGPIPFDGDPTNNFGDQGNSGALIAIPEVFDGSTGTGIDLEPFCFSVTFSDCTAASNWTPQLGVSGDGETGAHFPAALSCLAVTYSPNNGPNGDGSFSYTEGDVAIDCSVTNAAEAAGAACNGDNYEFDVTFDAVNDGNPTNYEVFDLTNCSVLGSGTGSPISATIANSSSVSPINVVVRQTSPVVTYQNNRTNNVINAYVNGSITATSTSDFGNAREIAVGNGLVIVAQDADAAPNLKNQLYVYDANPNSIVLNKVQDVSFNLWGIHYDTKADRLFAIEDNTNMLSEFDSYSTLPMGAISATMSIAVDGIIRTHGITYDAANDIMFLTDVGSGAIATDGAIIVVYNYTAAKADGTIDASEQIRIGGSMTFLGNPVDIAYAKAQNAIYVAERANSAGRILVFDMPAMGSAGGNIPPVNDDDTYDGAAGVYATSSNTVCASSNTMPVIRTYDAAFTAMDMTSLAGDADGIYCDNAYQSECIVITPNQACLCPMNLVLTGSEGGTVDNEAGINISSTQTIQAGADVDYDAGTDIDLNAGFCVEAGAVFDAFIDGCGGSAAQEESTETRK